jgi:putative endonuclease
MSRSGLIDKALELYRHHLDNTHGGSLTRQVDKRLCNSRYKRRPPGSHHWSEDIAAEFLQRQGLVLLVTNYRNRTGEIDLIMIDDQTLVFVEVKQRRDSRFGLPEESVGMAKQAKLRRTAASYLQRHDRLQSWSCRFDVVAITGNPQAPVCRWIQNAFH